MQKHFPQLAEKSARSARSEISMRPTDLYDNLHSLKVACVVKIKLFFHGLILL